MKKILAMFKGLPPEMRMLIAMAGLGTPLGLIYAVQRFLFPGVSAFFIIIGCAVLVAVVCALGLVISKVFGGRAKKRRQDMERELSAAGPGGPVGMDARAAIKDNNEKFFNAIRDMRKTLGLSVYDLPWYVVIGDSGCGKTKLINEGGLVFSTGRPEGYQLGTLNYNWWFTEDAIFIDMAGRLCNPQEDADRREWTAFLDTVAKGRKGFPVNGAVVCVSADHLLADPPEKQEQDANTMLERLRDLQNRLGVTFATYLVLTKCDKILGFMPFFDRPGKDITFKNQMFGWSKPGAYNELLDPEKFDAYFDELYQRLCELRLRRISEDADEIELGLAYTFPEEFRTLRDPLKIYLRTLFPAIKNPKAVKNLLFRGFYMTSATQEGEVVLKHLRQRLGEDAARQFQPLESLYPQPRPHFVKDLLVRKVIPENGLVFRNEQEVARNRKLARLLTLGSGVLSVLLVVALVWSFMSFDKLINSPRLVSRDVTETFKDKGGYSPETSLAKTIDLGEGVGQLRNRRWAARVLSLGIGTHEPIRDLTKVEMRLFEEGVLRPTLRDVEKGLRNPVVDQAANAESVANAAQTYRKALLVYAKWVGCSREPNVPASLAAEDIEVLGGAITEPGSPIKAQRDKTMDQVKNYFASLNNVEGGGSWPNPARLLTEASFDVQGTLHDAMRVVHAQFRPDAILTDAHPNPTIREWMRIARACRAMQDSYTAMVGPVGQQSQTLDQLAAFSGTFTGHFKEFDAAKEACAWKLEAADRRRVVIPPLRKAILDQRNDWVNYEKELQKAYAICGQSASSAPKCLAWLTTGDEQAGVTSLDRMLAESLRNDVKLTDQPYVDNFFDPVVFEKWIPEVQEQYKHIITLNDGSAAMKNDTIGLTPDTVAVHTILQKVNERFGGLDLKPSDDLSGETLAKWKEQLRVHLENVTKPAEKGATPTLNLTYKPEWREEQLASLLRDYDKLGMRGQGNRLLVTIRYRLDQVGDWGLAEVCTGWRDLRDSRYQIAQPAARGAKPVPEASPTTPTEQAPAAEPKEPERRVRRPGESSEPRTVQSPAQPTPAPSAAPPPAVTAALEGKIPSAAQAAFLNQTMRDLVEVEFYLKQFRDTDYLPSASAQGDLPKQCHDLLQTKAGVYIQQYVGSWATAYSAKQVPKLVRLQEQATGARTLEEVFTASAAAAQPDVREIAREAQGALGEVLRNVRWAKSGEDGKTWEEIGASDAEWQQDWNVVIRMWDEALANRWPKEYPRLVAGTNVPPSVPADNRKPWEFAAVDLERRWIELTSAIQQNVPLPDQFNATTNPRVEIPWERIDEFRQAWWLDDEHVTARLSAVAQQGRLLLNRQMSRILAGVQQRHLGGSTAFEGWPYVNPGGSGAAATDTVDYSKFRQFLWEVGYAEQTMRPLEKGIAENDSLKGSRAGLYGSCREWSKYLGAGPDARPTPMDMSVRLQDPVSYRNKISQASGIQDTAQHYYETVELALGLSIRAQGGAPSDAPLSVPTVVQAENRWEASWSWATSAAGGDMIMAFKGPIQRATGERYPTIPPQTLGRLSPLSFCAYLHRYGQQLEPGVWITAHSVDLAAAFRSAGAANLVPADGKQIMGVAFSFQLSQPMPPPIAPIAAP